MVLASVEDHVQTVQGKPHIRQIFESARRGGLWVKLNPSRASVLAVEPSLKTRSDLPENSANTPPADWDNYAYAYPEDVRDAVYHAAGVREMAERARSSTASLAQVVVDPAVRYQTIDGFGAGLTATGRGGVSLYSQLSVERRQALADLLWRELGLSTRLAMPDYRPRQGQVPWRQIASPPWTELAALAAQQDLPIWQTEMVGNVPSQLVILKR